MVLLSQLTDSIFEVINGIISLSFASLPYYPYRTLAVGVGLYGFILSKNSIDQRRYQDMKIRERMRQSNVGDYERSERRF